MSSQAPKLLAPLTIRGVTLPNRIVVAPMAQYSAKDGMTTDFHFAHFAKFAMGGAGVVFTEAAKVERRGLGTVGDMGIWKDEHIGPLERITAFIKLQGAVPAMQLNHAGRKAGTFKPWDGFGPLGRSVPVEGEPHWQVIAPSRVEYLPEWPLPEEMSIADIDTVRDARAASAKRALAAIRLFDRRPAKTRDGHICHWLATDQQYARFVEVLGFPEMKNDQRFARREQRVRNTEAFQKLVDEQLGTRTNAECVALFEQADVAAMPLNSLASLMEDRHLEAVGFFRTIEHPSEGSIVSMAVASNWSRSVPDNSRPAAHAGEHTREVLAESGFGASEIEQLLASGTVVQSSVGS